MAIQSIHHLFIEAVDFQAQLKFWLGLGFEVVDRWGDDQHNAARLVSGLAEVVLSESEVDRQEVVFRCESVERIADAFAGLSTSGSVDSPVTSTHWGTKLFRVKDPRGVVFTLEQKS